MDRLLELDEDHGRAIENLQGEMAAVQFRLTALEHRCDMILVEAKGAARAGAQDSMQGTMAEVSRRITLLEVATAKPKRISKPKQ